jgi:hypothetical protein
LGAALVQTNSAGEIVVLDSAGYGPVTIGKSVSITAPQGVYAGITTAADGVTINAPSIKVTLRNLVINLNGGQAQGVLVTAAASGSVVEIHSVSVSGFGNIGIKQAADSTMYLRDVHVSGMYHAYEADTASGTAAMTIERSVAQDFNVGYYAGGNAQLVIRDSTASGRLGGTSYAGFVAQGSPLGGGYIGCDGCLATNSLTGMVAGPFVGGSTSHLRVANSTIFKNGCGVCSYQTSTTTSFGNNRIYDNSTQDGFFDATVAPY